VVERGSAGKSHVMSAVSLGGDCVSRWRALTALPAPSSPLPVPLLSLHIHKRCSTSPSFPPLPPPPAQHPAPGPHPRTEGRLLHARAQPRVVGWDADWGRAGGRAWACDGGMHRGVLRPLKAADKPPDIVQPCNSWGSSSSSKARSELGLGVILEQEDPSRSSE
jgi:hypothetical protein